MCSIPRLYDVDLSFGANGSHVFGQFDPNTKPFRVYYHIRNMVRLSRKHSRQGSIVLFLNIFFWMIGLCILGLFEYGLTGNYFKRVKLMIQAVYAGYCQHSKMAKKLEESFFA